MKIATGVLAASMCVMISRVESDESARRAQREHRRGPRPHGRRDPIVSIMYSAETG